MRDIQERLDDICSAQRGAGVEFSLPQVNGLVRDSDVYSLGATLYHLHAGRAPVKESDLGSALTRVQRGGFLGDMMSCPRKSGRLGEPIFLGNVWTEG
jgi:serine/threonine protein kinase